MGTEPPGHRDATAPPGAGWAGGPGRGAGRMRAGYVQPGPPEALARLAARSPRRFRWVLGAVMVAPPVGLPLLFRLVIPGDAEAIAAGTDTSGLPGGLGWVQAGIGVLVAALGIAVYVWRQPVPYARTVVLPRQARRAVRRRGVVSDRYRNRVPAWLNQMRDHGVTAAGQVTSVCGMLLVLNAGNDPTWRQVLRGVAILGGAYLAVIGLVLAGWLWWVERLRRHYPAADGAAQRRS